MCVIADDGMGKIRQALLSAYQSLCMDGAVPSPLMVGGEGVDSAVERVKQNIHDCGLGSPAHLLSIPMEGGLCIVPVFLPFVDHKNDDAIVHVSQMVESVRQWNEPDNMVDRERQLLEWARCIGAIPQDNQRPEAWQGHKILHLKKIWRGETVFDVSAIVCTTRLKDYREAMLGWLNWWTEEDEKKSLASKPITEDMVTSMRDMLEEQLPRVPVIH